MRLKQEGCGMTVVDASGLEVFENFQTNERFSEFFSAIEIRN